ncbi:hypothetical protein RFI_07373 [Reticulomyxa filosa]|uniref:Uncharacterized protein n=1 Tax=Reticulomyxa filosa TaxID=46433 RepID=X6NTX0_RETFI|nr:hypothetical protein RFI_07373 [Reticulomyxa filosa]|eukprot:ETO29745.1 hypothetical protein RFI_07373 [Reticulomyxa filosa]
MAQPIKIQKLEPQKQQPLVSQVKHKNAMFFCIFANKTLEQKNKNLSLHDNSILFFCNQASVLEFYKTYIPPAPPLKPVAPNGSNDLTQIELPETTTITTIRTGPQSLTGKYAASLPVHKLTTFKTLSSNANKTDESKTASDNKEKEEIDTEANTNSERKTDNITVGSYTCLQLMGGRHSIPKAVTSSAIAHSRILRAGSEKVSNSNTDASKNKKSEPSEDEQAAKDIVEEFNQFNLEEDDENEEENEEESD